MRCSASRKARARVRKLIGSYRGIACVNFACRGTQLEARRAKLLLQAVFRVATLQETHFCVRRKKFFFAATLKPNQAHKMCRFLFCAKIYLCSLSVRIKGLKFCTHHAYLCIKRCVAVQRGTQCISLSGVLGTFDHSSIKEHGSKALLINNEIVAFQLLQILQCYNFFERHLKFIRAVVAQHVSRAGQNRYAKVSRQYLDTYKYLHYSIEIYLKNIQYSSVNTFPNIAFSQQLRC